MRDGSHDVKVYRNSSDHVHIKYVRTHIVFKELYSGNNSSLF